MTCFISKVARAICHPSTHCTQGEPGSSRKNSPNRSHSGGGSGDTTRSTEERHGSHDKDLNPIELAIKKANFQKYKKANLAKIAWLRDHGKHYTSELATDKFYAEELAKCDPH